MRKFFAFLMMVCLWSVNCIGADLGSSLRKTYVSCAGISDMLTDMKKMAGINTAVTGVGTVAGGGALIAGIKKQNLINKLREMEESPEKEVRAYNDIRITQQPNFKPNLKSKKKELGNWRTGLLVANTATNVAGAIIASKNLNTDKDLETRVKECVDSVDSLQKSMIEAKFENVDITEAKFIYDVCSEWKYVDLSVVKKRTKSAQVLSIIGGGAGAAGVITSAVANNSDNVDNEKKLDNASNLLAGGATVLSGGATVFNAMQISAIKKIANVAEQCEGALE